MKISNRILLVGAVISCLAYYFIKTAFFRPAHEQLVLYFNSDSARNYIGELFQKAQILTTQTKLNELPGWPNSELRVWRIPKEHLPLFYRAKWGLNEEYDTDRSGDVLAYQNKSGAIVGIHFVSSRTGCFISKNPTLAPPHYKRLIRISESPWFISIIDSEMDDS